MYTTPPPDQVLPAPAPPALRKRRLYEQWCRFHRGEAPERAVVREEILRSWERCRAARVDPFQPVQKLVGNSVLERERATHAELLESAHTLMDNVFSLIAASRSTMVLATARGVVLRVLPREEPMTAEGSLARECHTGTAGIATCLEERRPVEIFAAEHYCASNHNYVCSAAPVFDRWGNMVGALGVTSHCDSFHPHTSGMIGAAAQAITEQLRLREALGEQRALMELLDEGVIMLDGAGTICSVNRKALNMLGLDTGCAGRAARDVLRFGDRVETLLASGAPFHDEETTLHTAASACSCVLSAAVNRTTGGRVLTLREGGRMREFAARITGAKATYTFDDILGTSAPLRETVRQARRAAAGDITTLILGESGTGKELFAQAIHNAGARSGRAFIVVNCGALPRELVQSELFGYTEGAFTGASRQGKPGKFELADGGTLFLDEIGDMPLDAQVSLLRLLQNGEVTRVGGKRARRVDVRVMAATNRDLMEAVRQNTFREDLYYRLNVLTLTVPPLRERGPGDVRALVHAFLDKFARTLDHPVRGVEDSALDLLCHYAWPGNIRELENAVERAVHMASGPFLQVEDLPAAVIRATDGVPDAAPSPRRAQRPGTPREREATLLIEALRVHRGHVRRAARALGVSRSTLYYQAHRLGLDLGAFRAAAPQGGARDISCSEAFPRLSEQEETLLKNLDDAQLDALSGLLEACRRSRKNG